MKKYSNSAKRRTGVDLLVLMVAWLCVIPAWTQNTERSARARAVDPGQSRAAREAEELVSLSADRIITILREEPGLLLQSKRLLVRKAYEQGRLLDPADLTDEALYDLIREDGNARVLITREIERRYYVRAKPTEEEIGSGLVPERQNRKFDQEKTGGELERTQSQEEAYWAERDVTTPQSRQPTPAPPQEPAPETTPAHDARRQVERASSLPPAEDLSDTLPADAAGMPRIRPNDLPELLTASITEKSFGGVDRPSDQLAPYPYREHGLTASVPASPDMSRGGQEQPPQPNRPDNARRQSFARSAEVRPEQQHLRHRANPYADVPSLFDLYSQYSSRGAPLQRFGADLFRTGTGNFDELPMDLPVGPEYVLGPGDGLNVELWGAISQRLQRVVDRSGRVALPEVGAVQVAGRSLGDVQTLVQGVLRTQFRDIQADVSLSRLRTVRVYVVGDVERPGAYDVSALSTPLNALYLAGGPTARGSLRIIRHYRSKQLVQEIDVYDLLLHGIRSGVQGLQPGDTILVPPLGPEITVEGMVRRPAMYELDGEKNLAEVLELAGGVLQSGTLRHVDVERVQAHLSRTMLRLDIPENNNQDSVTQALEGFQVQDGDKIKISPILPYADKTVYLDGHVFRPGKYAYREGMKVTDLIKSYSELLPEPFKRHAEIIRLNPPDSTPVVLAFNLDAALGGKDQDLVLRPFDTVRVFGRFDFEDPPVVTVSGEVRDPGDHITNGATYLRDAIYLAGGVSPDALLDDAQVFRKTEDGKLKVIAVNLGRALGGDDKENILLEPKDRIFVHKNLTKVDPPSVMIQGEVARPGKYPLGEDMTASVLVRLAGGFKRGAYTEAADLTRYGVNSGGTVSGEHLIVPIARAMALEADTDVRLRDGDVLTIRQLTGWNDVGATITVKGEVLHPGTYGIKEGERLSSILARAGNFRDDAYPYGAIFERVQVREMEQRNRAELIRTVQDEGTALKLTVANDQEDKIAKEASLLQWKTTIERLQNTPPVGRLVIHISRDVKRWANTAADIEVRAGDVIYIPKKANMVMVDGAVYNPTAVTFRPGKSAGWYLSQAGGPTNMANKKAMFVIRADGSVVGGKSGLFTGSAEHAVLMPGDMVITPEKAFSGSSRWKNTLQAAQLAQAVGISIQVARAF